MCPFGKVTVYLKSIGSKRKTPALASRSSLRVLKKKLPRILSAGLKEFGSGRGKRGSVGGSLFIPGRVTESDRPVSELNEASRLVAFAADFIVVAYLWLNRDSQLPVGRSTRRWTGGEQELDRLSALHARRLSSS